MSDCIVLLRFVKSFSQHVCASMPCCLSVARLLLSYSSVLLFPYTLHTVGGGSLVGATGVLPAGSSRPPIPKAKRRQDPPIIRNPYMQPAPLQSLSSSSQVEDHVYHASSMQHKNQNEQPAKVSRLK